MNRGILRRLGGTLMFAMFVGAVAWPLSVSAATHVIELDRQDVRGEEGERVALGTFDTPTDLIGNTCSVTASGNNNTSVHPENDVEVTSQNTVVLVGVEDTENKTTTASGSLTLSDVISFTLVLGPDGVYSAELQVTLDCQPASTTTSSTTSTSTTTSQATSTTTTTIPPETSSTSITSTTAAPEGTTTTTVPPEVSPTTAAPTTTVGDTSDTLPFTGVGSGDLAAVAYVALAAGTGLVLLTRRRDNLD